MANLFGAEAEVFEGCGVALIDVELVDIAELGVAHALHLHALDVAQHAQLAAVLSARRRFA